MESLDERAARLLEAQNKFLEHREGPDGLIGLPEVLPEAEPELSKPANPLEDSMYDALIYLREGMTPQHVVEMIIIRNRIKKEDAERIVAQVIKKG